MMSWLEEETAQEANTPRTPNMEKEERRRARSKSGGTPGRDTTSHARLHTERAPSGLLFSSERCGSVPPRAGRDEVTLDTEQENLLQKLAQS